MGSFGILFSFSVCLTGESVVRMQKQEWMVSCWTNPSSIECERAESRVCKCYTRISLFQPWCGSREVEDNSGTDG